MLFMESGPGRVTDLTVIQKVKCNLVRGSC